ncbi:unnamed protein product [Arctia plantaginis]|uniref:Reverse transcriptase domain-containing protein n=1 Tax=Arctia plantaginis TaxID=874455 RepID=A0A8S0YND8_ARCPL|nr:unnamed protein product [Arctia plantaginis]
MIFILRQLQEKCREHRTSYLFLAFVDLNKAFDALYAILLKVRCPPQLLSLIRSFHDNMKGSALMDAYLTHLINLSLDADINIRIDKASMIFGKLGGSVWYNKHLTIKAMMIVYQTCMLSILFYGAETWTSYAKQERKSKSFNMRCLRHILGISWKDKLGKLYEGICAQANKMEEIH